MTVTELIDRIVGAYPGATLEAMKSFKPVFYARFKHREGPHLEEAALEVLSNFRPKASQPFPIPADFEAHMPSLRSIKTDEAPIGKWLEERHQRAKRLYEAWHGSQGMKIKAARPQAVYGARSSEAYAMAKTTKADHVRLSPEDIALCEQRAVSSARVHRFGPLPASNEIWDAQCAEIRAGWQQAQAA